MDQPQLKVKPGELLATAKDKQLIKSLPKRNAAEEAPRSFQGKRSTKEEGEHSAGLDGFRERELRSQVQQLSAGVVDVGEEVRTYPTY